MKTPASSIVFVLLLVPGAGTEAWNWYKASLQRRPLLTKSATSAVMLSVSDLLCQKLEAAMDNKQHDPRVKGEKQRSLLTSCDWERAADAGLVGFTFVGPMVHTWYEILETIVQVENRLLRIAVMVFLDAFIFTPVIAAGYFTWITLLEGKGFSGAIDKLRSKLAVVVVTSWKFWPIVNLICFAFVPLEFRVLYNNSFSLLWNGYLSHMNAKHSDTTPPASEDSHPSKSG